MTIILLETLETLLASFTKVIDGYEKLIIEEITNF